MQRQIPALFIGLLTGLTRLAAQEDTQITKIRFFTQTTPAAPVLDSGTPFRFDFLGKTLATISQSVTITLPSGASRSTTVEGQDRAFRDSAATDASLNAVYGSGSYVMTVNFGGIPVTTTVNLGADAYPVVPHVINFAAAQVINPVNDFVVSWNPFTGGGDTDFIIYRVRDPNGVAVINARTSGIETSHTVPAGTLSSGTTYALELTFMKIIERATPEAGLPLASAFATTTTLQIKTSGPGGGPDITPPVLREAKPALGESLANAFAAATFLFNEPMDKTRNPVAWNATKNGAAVPLVPSSFTYGWSSDGTLLSAQYDATGAGWPDDLTVVWGLSGDSAGFRDVAGNPLASTGGSFKTQTSTPVNCHTNGPVETAGFTLIKFVNHLQSSTEMPGIDPTNGAMFQAFSRIPSSPGRAAFEYPANPAPQPHRTNLLTQLIAGVEFFMESFQTQSAIDSAYPAGGYDFQIRDRSQPSTILSGVVLTFQPNGDPPVPHFADYAAAQMISADADFTLSWDAFTGASETNDFISLDITDANGTTIFSLPDACKKLTLPVTSTSALLPKGLLRPGQVYVATLTFFRQNDSNKLLPGTSSKGFAAAGRVTRMQLKTKGGTTLGTPPVLRDLFVDGAGELDITVDATVGRPFTLLRSSMLDGQFTDLILTNPPAATFHLKVPIGVHEFFRGRTD